MNLKPASFLHTTFCLKPPRQIDGPTLAAAYRAKPRSNTKPKARALFPAITPGPCGFCGIRGSNGCDHFLPHVPQATNRKGNEL